MCTQRALRVNRGGNFIYLSKESERRGIEYEVSEWLEKYD
jgi:hypothetical protein